MGAFVIDFPGELLPGCFPHFVPGSLSVPVCPQTGVCPIDGGVSVEWQTVQYAINGVFCEAFVLRIVYAQLFPDLRH